MTSNPTIESLTYHAALVLDNDYDAYQERCALVAEHLQGEDKQYPHLLGDKLKEWAEDHLTGPLFDGPVSGMSDAGMMLAHEMVHVALAWVDWRTLAERWIEDSREG